MVVILIHIYYYNSADFRDRFGGMWQGKENIGILRGGVVRQMFYLTNHSAESSLKPRVEAEWLYKDCTYEA